MGKRTAQPSAAAASDNAARVQLGPYWLEYRAERDDWSICWYDPEARTRRRRKTGVGGSGRLEPPEAAREALARHYLEASKPTEPQPKAAAIVPDIFAVWQREHVAKKRSEEHTSELQSLMRTSYAVFCLKKKTIKNQINEHRPE